VDKLVKRESGSASFGAKMVPYLWSADPSIRNSVAGSGSRAKCSNILQDSGGSTISNGRKPKSCFGLVFNFKLGCFAKQEHE
jgi:hypothetical protein